MKFIFCDPHQRYENLCCFLSNRERKMNLNDIEVKNERRRRRKNNTSWFAFKKNKLTDNEQTKQILSMKSKWTTLTWFYSFFFVYNVRIKIGWLVYLHLALREWYAKMHRISQTIIMCILKESKYKIKAKNVEILLQLKLQLRLQSFPFRRVPFYDLFQSI